MISNAIAICTKQNFIPKQQLDTQEALVRQYEGIVKADQGQIDNAKLQLTYSSITAPIDGRIGLRLVDAGNIVHANDPNGLLVITQLQPITVVFALAEDHLPAVFERTQGREAAGGGGLRSRAETKISNGHVAHCRQSNRSDHWEPFASKRCFRTTTARCSRISS